MSKPITKERLERYLKDLAGLERLSRIAPRKVRDLVKGSLDEHPYTQVDISVVGLDERIVRYYRQKKRHVEAERKAILAFVDRLDDLYMADLIRKRYLEQKSWVDIWKEHNCMGTVESYRMNVSRYLDK